MNPQEPPQEPQAPLQPEQPIQAPVTPAVEPVAAEPVAPATEPVPALTETPVAPAAAPATPVEPSPVTDQPAAQSEVAPAQPVAPIQPTTQAGKVLGIVAFILSLLGGGIISLVLGIIALSQSKKAGTKNVFALVAVILSIVGLIIGGAFIGMGLLATTTVHQ